jgi:hypothetical protein
VHELKANDYFLEALDPLPKPPLTVAWLEANVPEYVAIQLRALHHFKIDGRNLNSYPKQGELLAYFKSVRLSNGKFIAPTDARHLAMHCRPAKAKDGGRPQGKKNS